MSKIEIKLSELSDLVQEGKGKKELAEIYGLSVGQIGKVLKQAGLKTKRDTTKFILVDDLETKVEELPSEISNITTFVEIEE